IPAAAHTSERWLQLCLGQGGPKKQMIKILTAVGQVNLWDDKKLEIANSDFDALKKEMILTFLLRDNQGKEFSVDKLKIYGVKNIDGARGTFELVSKSIESIDLTKQTEIRLCDKQGTSLQAIECDKYEYNQKRVRTA